MGQLPEFKKSDPNLTVPQLMKKISVAWSQVSEQEKNKLQDLYLKERESYQRKLAKVPEDVMLHAKASKDRKKASKSVRNQYEQKASKDLERYQKEMSAWQTKLEKDGTDQIISELQQRVSELKKRAKE